MNPDPSPIERLKSGVRRFRTGAYPAKIDLFKKLADGQKPGILFIACADSRVDPALITQSEPGEIFVCRNIGNIVPAHGETQGEVSAVIEYACNVLKVSDIVVCGHSDCGAMKALSDPEGHRLAEIPAVASWLRNAEEAKSVVRAERPELSGVPLVHALTEQNVRLQMRHLRTHPPVAGRLADRRLRLHGWVYDIGTGMVREYDEDEREFRPVTESAIA